MKKYVILCLAATLWFSNTKAQLTGFWLEEDASIGLLLSAEGYCTMFLNGELSFSGEGEELGDGSTAIMIYRVTNNDSYNYLDLEIQSLPNHEVLKSYKGIYYINDEGIMVLCCEFEDGAGRPTEFNPDYTFRLNYYDI